MKGVSLKYVSETCKYIRAIQRSTSFLNMKQTSPNNINLNVIFKYSDMKMSGLK